MQTFSQDLIQKQPLEFMYFELFEYIELERSPKT